MLSLLLLECAVTTNVLSRSKINVLTCFIQHFHLSFPPSFLKYILFFSIYGPLSQKKKRKRNVTLVTLCDVRSAPWKFSSHFHIEDSCLLGRVAVLLWEHFPMFRKIVVPGFITQLHSRTLYPTAPLFPCIA